ncbi:MAG: hypothetical protein NTZ38_01460 [Candidatus Taylorbacteria bacterium]|nr:hypothetical protein [Candidatus Taylorbacteria bacterium]
MNEKKTVFQAEEYLDLLVKGQISARDGNITVQGEVIINGHDEQFKSLTTIELCSATFTDLVLISNFERFEIKQQFTCSLTLSSSNFLGGLLVEKIGEGDIGRFITIHGCTAKWVKFVKCEVGTITVKDLTVDDSLNISGIHASDGINLDGVICHGLNLISDVDRKFISASIVRTDDPIIALQFHFAGIPVFMSSKAIKKMRDDARPLGERIVPVMDGHPSSSE